MNIDEWAAAQGLEEGTMTVPAGTWRRPVHPSEDCPHEVTRWIPEYGTICDECDERLNEDFGGHPE